MEYKFSLENFEKTFLYGDDKKIRHTSNFIKFYPYASQDSIIGDFTNVAGMYLCNLQNKRPKYLDMETVADEIVQKIGNGLKQEDEEFFKEVIKKLYFNSDNTMLKNNFYMLQQGAYKEEYLNETGKKQSKLEKDLKNEQASENKIAVYMMNVLGHKENIQKILNDITLDRDRYNLCECLLLDVIEKNMKEYKSKETITKFFRGFDDVYEKDFEYVINFVSMTREYLQMLLELYYLVYTIQTAIQLCKMEQGDYNKCSPIYFSLDWEQTSQSRKCYREGWKNLKIYIEQIFAHEKTVELLNQVVDGAGTYDYIKLAEMAKESEDVDRQIAKEISELRECYSLYIDDNNQEIKILELSNDESSDIATINEYKYLFKIVKEQFLKTKRKEPYDKYANKLIEFCKAKFIKNRGRSGGMLNLTEEMVIFLTKLALKQREKMRLTDVFIEFEKRGIFLDEKSKEEVDRYYERLNLIEKKSDSGDAKYVKRIL